MRIAPITTIRIGERRFEQLIDLDDDSTLIVDAEDRRDQQMVIDANGSVNFPAHGPEVHGWMRLNAVLEWVYQPAAESPVPTPFSTGNTELIEGEVELFKTYAQIVELGVTL